MFFWRRNKRSAIFIFSITLYGLILVSFKNYNQKLDRDFLVKTHIMKNEWLLQEGQPNLIGTRNQTCVHPNMPLWNKEIEQYIEIAKPVTCGEEDNWVYTRNGKFYISMSSERKHGKILCKYEAIVNSNEDFTVLEPMYPMLNGSSLISDAFRVSCTAADGKAYSNTHACIAPQFQSVQAKHLQSSDNFNVLILGLDSLSRQMFMRLLPKTHKYFTEVLGGSLLEGYNIVGDGTTQALMPLLTGKRETEIPETRRGKPGARHVDEFVEFVWKRYEEKGYVTQWAEDMAHISAFNLRLLGFKNQPVIHYMRPFYLATQEQKSIFSFFEKSSTFCLGSKSTYEVYLDWLREIIETYKGRNFFSGGFISSYTHDNNKDATMIDDQNVDFLKYLITHNLIDDTFVIVMSDHGLRYGKFRMTEQGKLEERMPYFGIFVPRRFRDLYPSKYQTFLKNTGRLIVPSDIHETLLDIINEKSDFSETEIKRSVYSLFSPIPETRTCADAGIDPHWCACLKTNTIPVADKKVMAATQKVVSVINELMQDFASKCHKLSLSKIIKALSLGTDENVLKFKKSADRDGRVADLGDNLSREIIHFIITFETIPGFAVFEASVSMNIKTGDIVAPEKEISRLNRYGDAPKCIEKLNPALMLYCYCR